MRIARVGPPAVLCALLAAASASAIEAPEQQAEPRGEKSALDDQTDFYEVLQRSSHTRALRGLDIPQSAIDWLAKGAADEAVAELSARAAQGDLDANVALVRIQHWCNRISSARPPDPQSQIQKLDPGLTGERAGKAAGVIHAQTEFYARASQRCAAAQFDYGGIEARLREAAVAGHPASAVELAQFVRDPSERKALLESAVEKNYPPAMYAAAADLLVAVQRGQTTENVSSIRLLLKQAGRTLPKAKLDLANCMALGCDGHPADALTARAFGLDAARDGEPSSFLSMMRMPWGGRLTRTQHLAWQYFGDRLNEAGCFGENYVAAASQTAQAIATLEKGQSPETLEEARRQALILWRDNGTRAMREQGCWREGSG